MVNVWITISIPFGGKSTWALKFLTDHPDAVVICPDEIRKEICGNINDQSKNSIVFSTAFKRVVEAMRAGAENIVFDGTNIKNKTRSAIMQCADALHLGDPDVLFHYVVFPCDLKIAYARKKADADRIAKGERSDVPDEIILKFFNDFQNNIDNILVDSRVESIKVFK